MVPQEKTWQRYFKKDGKDHTNPKYAGKPKLPTTLTPSI
jgi:hypothetical protein